MISFKQFLAESRYQPLYHGTYIGNLSDILDSNRLETGFFDDVAHWPSKQGRVVSLTRDFKFAYEWKNYKQCVIELDGDKLRRNYRVVPFNFFGIDYVSNEWELPKTQARQQGNKKSYGTPLNQFEEVVDRPITNIKKYITKVWIAKGFTRDFEYAVKTLGKDRVGLLDTNGRKIK